MQWITSVTWVASYSVMPQSARLLTIACPTQASSSFGRLSKRVQQSHSLCLSTKIQVYRAVIIPTLLYGAETWVLYWKHIKLLEQFYKCCLRSNLGIKWQDHESNEEVLTRTCMPSIESILLQVQVQWAGHHVKKMEDVHMPKAVFFNEKESMIVVLQESIAKTS